MKTSFSLPRISIVTPSFNQGKYLERTILSVINQDYPNIEYIIIDGGSSDNSVEIIKKYEKYIYYWESKEDYGQSHALNKGFSKATGEIWGYINSDDVYLFNSFNLIARVYNEKKENQIYYGHANMIDENDKYLDLLIALPFKLNEFINGVFSIPQPSSFWTPEVYRAVKGFNENNETCMDGEFYTKAALNNYKFTVVDSVLSSFRLHNKSKTGAKDKELLKKYNKDKQAYIDNIIQLSTEYSKSSFKGYFFRLKYFIIKRIKRYKLLRR